MHGILMPQRCKAVAYILGTGDKKCLMVEYVCPAQEDRISEFRHISQDVSRSLLVA
jgi:hypothetical protein